MTKTQIEKIDAIYREIKNLLIVAKENGTNIENAIGWLGQLRDSVIEKDYKFNNSAYIWFKNARHHAPVFEDIWEQINELSGYIYI